MPIVGFNLPAKFAIVKSEFSKYIFRCSAPAAHRLFSFYKY